MKLRHLVFLFSLLLFVCNLYGQTSHAEHLIFPFLTIESQSNIIVTADWRHPKPCPPEYTNLLSNTNLFSLAEQKRLEEITLKYQNVTTNSGLMGSVLKGFSLRQEKVETWTNTFRVACFAYTNSDAQEEIRLDAPGHIVARFRTQVGDGYDVSVVKGLIFAYQEYKRWVLDGLFVVLHDPNNPSDREHCGMWARFVKGKTLGKFLMWGQDNKIVVEAEFKEPFDFLKYESTKMDLAWTEVPITNSIQNP